MFSMKLRMVFYDELCRKICTEEIATTCIHCIQCIHWIVITNTECGKTDAHYQLRNIAQINSSL